MKCDGGMEFDYYSPSETFVVPTADQFVGRDDGLLEQQKQDSHVITCALCKKLYTGETGRRLGDRFREHLRDVEKDDKNVSKPVARHFYLPNHSKQNMVVCGLSLHQGSTENRKTLTRTKIYF